MKFKTIKAITFWSLLLFNSSLFAQDDKELPGGKVEVISSYEARLAEAEKLPLNGQIGDIKQAEKNYTYDISSVNRDKKPSVKYAPPQIRPLGMSTEKLPEPYNGYAKLGISYPLGIFGEGGYSISNNETYFLNLAANHQSVFVAPRIDQKYAETGIKGTGTVYLENGMAINGLAAIDLNNYRLYGGYDAEDTLFATEFSKRNYRNFEAGINLYNGKKNKMDIDYWAGGKFYNYSNNFNTRESNLGLDLGVTKWFANKHEATVQITNSLLGYKDTINENLNNLNIKPSFTFHGNVFKLKVGANLVSSPEGFSFFPDAEASVNLAGPAIMVFAGAGGDMYQNTFKRLTTENPFLSLHGGSPFNTKYFDYYGGVAGGFRNVSYRLKAGYRPYKNYPLFVQQKVDLRQFDILVDDVNVVYFGGELSATFFSKLQTSLTALGQISEARHYAKVFGLVPFTLGIKAAYLALEDKLRIKGDLSFAGGSYYRNRFDSEGQLNPLFDLSIGADYYIFQNFGLFINLNNLASVKYQRWYKYPTYGINVVGGLSLRF